jgi:hypothetical protein
LAREISAPAGRSEPSVRDIEDAFTDQMGLLLSRAANSEFGL